MTTRSTPAADIVVDGTGLLCVTLLLRLRAAIDGTSHGTAVHVIATDPAKTCTPPVADGLPIRTWVCTPDHDPDHGWSARGRDITIPPLPRADHALRSGFAAVFFAVFLAVVGLGERFISCWPPRRGHGRLVADRELVVPRGRGTVPFEVIDAALDRVPSLVVLRVALRRTAAAGAEFPSVAGLVGFVREGAANATSAQVGAVLPGGVRLISTHPPRQCAVCRTPAGAP